MYRFEAMQQDLAVNAPVTARMNQSKVMGCVGRVELSGGAQMAGSCSPKPRNSTHIFSSDSPDRESS